MRQAFSAETEVTPAELFEVVGDLSTYPHWLDLVSDVDPAGEPDAWLVTLRARVGPFSRSKRLRMVRSIHQASSDDEPSLVRFERQEVDGREHSDWVLAAEVRSPDGDRARSRVDMELFYDGALWSGPLESLLGSAANRATAKLADYVTAGTA